MKKIYVFVPIFLIMILTVTAILPMIETSRSVSEKVFRLHIIANSDSEPDQALKLKVRDNVLKSTKELFENCGSVGQAESIAQDSINLIKDTADKTVSDNGFAYSIRAYTAKEYFTTRKYDGFTLPAGYYNCLKIIIGEGKGKNWWCVMFPAVCISGCTDSFDGYLSDDEQSFIKNDKYIVKFKIVELYERIINKIS